MDVTTPVTPFPEPCVPSDVPVLAAPAGLTIPDAEGRLIPELREVAVRASRNTREALAKAAARMFRAQETHDRHGRQVALAMADLAVTGGQAYGLFRAARLTEADLVALTEAELGGLPDRTRVLAAITAVLDRAHQVAWGLRGSPSRRGALRAWLGWVAVSAEDDAPHRPVNVASAPYPQFDLPINLGSVSLRTRLFVASPDSEITSVATPSWREIPPDPPLGVPDGEKVVLFIHGHSSCAEEALSLIPHLHRAGLDRGERFAVVAMDLPNCGYATMFDHVAVARSEATTFPAEFLIMGRSTRQSWTFWRTSSWRSSTRSIVYYRSRTGSPA